MKGTKILKALLALLRAALALLLVPAAVVGSFMATRHYLQNTGSPDLQAIAAFLAKYETPNVKILIAAGLLFLFNLINRLIDWKTRNSTRPVFTLFVPLFLVSVLSSSDFLFEIIFSMTLALFILRKANDFSLILPMEPASKEVASRSMEILQFFSWSVLIIFIPLCFSFASSTPQLLVAIWASTYLFSLIALRGRIRLFLKVESVLSLFLAVQALVFLVLSSILKNYDGRIVAGQLGVLLVLLHLTLFYFQHAQLRWFNLVMPALTLIGLIALEAALTPYHLGERRAPSAPAGRQSDAIILTNQTFNYIYDVAQDHFRGKKPTLEKPPKVFRIIAQGSSTTEGYGVKMDADVWPAVLETRLNRLGKPYRFETYNAGWGGTNSFFLFLNFQKALLKYKPDLLILYLANNDTFYQRGPFTEHELFEMATQNEYRPSLVLQRDALPAVREAKKGERLTAALLRTQLFLSRFSLYRLLVRQELDLRDIMISTGRINFPLNQYVQFVPKKDFQENLENYAELCRQNGIILVLIGEGVLTDLHVYKSIMASVAQSYHLVYYDANDGLMGCTDNISELFLDKGHLTIKGNVCLAEIIVNLFEAEKVLPEKLK